MAFCKWYPHVICCQHQDKWSILGQPPIPSPFPSLPPKVTDDDCSPDFSLPLIYLWIVQSGDNGWLLEVLGILRNFMWSCMFLSRRSTALGNFSEEFVNQERACWKFLKNGFSQGITQDYFVIFVNLVQLRLKDSFPHCPVSCFDFFTPVFLIVVNIHIITFTLSTIFKCPVGWHQVRSHCCATIITVHL